MRLIQLLVKQHNGALEHGPSRQGGARFVVTLG
jgi:K+-sensing histidine kinase KdpD